MKLVKKLDLACGQAYLVTTEDNHYLECGDVFMAREESYGTRPYRFVDFQAPSDNNKRVMTICTIAGCPMNCSFCASRRSFKRKLSQEEIIEQVDFMINNGISCGRDSDPNNSQEFRILYTRMGEPMLNVEAVINSIKVFISRYPGVIIGMSTCGIRQGLEKLLESPELLPRIDMQISFHSTENSERDILFGVKTGVNIMDIAEIAEFSKRWFNLSGKKLCLNIILFEGYSYDIGLLMRYFNSEHIWLRLSPWNEVPNIKMQGLLKEEDVINKKPLSSQYLKNIIREIEAFGIAYAYAPAIDEEIKHNVACGQALVAFLGGKK